MKKESQKIVIVGAGVSGLIAAKVLEEAGYQTILIEESDRIGGRLKTDTVDGFELDHGFQVLLTQYPAVQKYLDLKALDLISLWPGAAILKNGRHYRFGDPLRSLQFLLPVLTSPLATLKDKWLTYALTQQLKKETPEAIFEKPSSTTLDYLRKKGFSQGIIDNFFRPFYAGIFLEPHLDTSSRMFEFIFKMFAEGSAAIPREGMKAIPEQLFAPLKNTNLRLNTKVAHISDDGVVLQNGEEILADAVIVACKPPQKMMASSSPDQKWNGCYNFYFEVDRKLWEGPLIGLVERKDALINNVFHPTSIHPSPQKGKHLLSVTVLNPKNNPEEKSENAAVENESQLVTQVQASLRDLYQLNEVRFIKAFYIPQSLPVIEKPYYHSTPSLIKFSKRIYLAGDAQSNASLNGAMLSGETAAKTLIEDLPK